jgi:hypothetical protein
VIALFALLAAVVIPVFPHFVSPNELTRWALVASVVEHGTIEVSAVASILGPRFEDLAVIDGRQYSNKAPGAALIAAPGYLVVRPFIGPPSRENLRVALTAMRWSGTTIPLVLMFIAAARAARRRGGDAAFAIAVIALATPLLAYGLLLFSHALVGAALFGAWLLLYVERKWAVAAGALIGVAVAAEYPVVLAAAVLAGGLLLQREWRRLALVIAGGAPFAILLAVYQHAAFGSITASPYLYEKSPEYRALAHTGLFGLQWPNPSILLRILFDPSRGLLLFSPVLIAALAALPAARRRLPRDAFVTLLLVPLAVIGIYSGYPNWHGGWNVGPRYVVSAIPFLAFPLALGETSAAALVLFGVSVATVAPIALTFPFPDRSFVLPWATLGWPLLRDGLIAPNAFHFVARALAIAVPAAIVAAAIIVVAGRRAAWVFAGSLLTVIVSTAAVKLHPPDLTQRLRVGYIEEVYFERDGAMQRMLPPAAPVPPRATARAEAEKRLPPTSWPF